MEEIKYSQTKPKNQKFSICLTKVDADSADNGMPNCVT